MSWQTKAALVFVGAIANLAVLWWRYEHQTPEINGVGPFIAALGAAQADTVIAWRNAPSVPLTNQSISEFVERMKWGDCAPLPSRATAVSREELPVKRQKALYRMLTSLIEVYSQADPGRLYDLMAGMNEELSPSSSATLRRLLTTDGDMPEESVKRLGPRELFVLMGQKIHYGAHWQSLVSESACVTLWRTHDSSDLLETFRLGGSMAGQFKNQTRYHHLFQKTAKQQQVAQQEKMFADVQFVVKHDRRQMSEPSAYHIRLILDPATEMWHPVEMVHVATISGNSPALLF